MARVKSYVILSVVYTCMHLTHICLSCVMLLNGWTPMSVKERAELAEIVGVAKVVRTFKAQPADDDTYNAEVKILTLYKGHESMPEVTESPSTTLESSNVFSVSNFGSKTKCYADVDAGQTYVMFLTIFDGKLSAHYDDLFGAAEPFSIQAEMEVLSYLGWDAWSEWSPCTASCGTGVQYRQRECPQVNGTQCVGEGKEVRTCNTFYCQGVFDLLTLTGVRDLPLGVELNPNRTSAYVIGKKAKLSAKASRIFYDTFPANFSILFKVKMPERRRSRGYFFTVTDSRGRQQLAIFFGRKLKFHYLGNNYSFKVSVLDNNWHTLGLKVNGSELHVYAGCDVVMKRRLRHSGDYLGTNLILSIGAFLPKFGRPFKGQVEQLVISSLPGVSSKQCGTVFLHPSQNDSTELNDSTTTFGELVLTTSLPVTSHFSDCDFPCLNGGVCVNSICQCLANYTGVRCQSAVCVPACQNGGVCISPGQCVCSNGYSGPVCQYDCNVPCYNGGECVGNSTCHCSSGYTGPQCETPVCPGGCENGGQCIAPLQCACPAGFYGRRCHLIRCRPRCKHGGVCISPGVCACKPGYSGKRCQKATKKCSKGCLNGGRCNPAGKCVCPPPFYGRRCHKERCQLTCFHGGKCHKNQCRCPPGFSGKMCERRSCNYQAYMVPYRRTYRKIIREEFPIPCHPNLKQQTCTKTRFKYILITKDTYRTAYRCV